MYSKVLNFQGFSSSIFFRKTIRVSNGLDPDQDWHSVGPDMGPNCLQTLRLSADNKIWLACREFKFLASWLCFSRCW